jgi:membrane-bound metal-dependent hydrolase YbcI (DUF457 family)
MRRYPHLLIGAAAGLGVSRVLYPEVSIEWLAVAGSLAAFSSAVPDVDQRWASRNNKPEPGSAPGLFDHRGPTHTILAAFLGYIVIVMSAGFIGLHDANFLGVAFMSGYISHLVADGLSYMGVPFLWPIWPCRIRLLPYGMRLRSGSMLEWPISIGALVLVSGVSTGVVHAEPAPAATQRALANLANDCAQAHTRGVDLPAACITPTATPTRTPSQPPIPVATSTPAPTETPSPTATPGPPCWTDEDGNKWLIVENNLYFDEDGEPYRCPDPLSIGPQQESPTEAPFVEPFVEPQILPTIPPIATAPQVIRQVVVTVVTVYRDVPRPADTPVPTETPTPFPTETSTPTPISMSTSTPTPTPTSTATRVPTSTSLPTVVPTVVPTAAPTPAKVIDPVTPVKQPSRPRLPPIVWVPLIAPSDRKQWPMPVLIHVPTPYRTMAARSIPPSTEISGWPLMVTPIGSDWYESDYVHAGSKRFTTFEQARPVDVVWTTDGYVEVEA